MSETTDRKIFAQEMNWIVFIFLLVILSAINGVILLLPIEANAKGVIVVTGMLINVIFWIDSFYWLKKLPNRRYLTDYYGRLAFIGNLLFLTPIRLLQIILFYRKLRKLKIRPTKDIRIKQNSQGVLLLFLFAAIVIFQMAGVSILIFESNDPSANIVTSEDALWWSLVTVATVGYGDKFPITTGGRVVALFLMIVGIAMFGIFTSTLSDWFRRPRRKRKEEGDEKVKQRAITLSEMQQLLDQQSLVLQSRIDRLEEKLSQLENK